MGARRRVVGRRGPISVIARARALGSSSLMEGGGLAFFVAVGVANVANFLFHVVMSRMLGPAVYGALGSILGLATVVTLAVTAFQAAVIQAVAELRHAQGPDAPMSVGRSVRRTLVVCGVLLLVVVAASPLLRGFLHLGSLVPVVLFGGFVAAMVATLVPQGVLIGRLRFRVVALALALGGALRLATGALFVGLGWGLNGAVAATVVNALGTLAVLLWPLRAELVGHANVASFRFSVRSALLAVVALGGVSAFVGLDSFLARHYLARGASGYYVAAATAGRIALFLPAAVGTMAFPRLAAHGGRGPEAAALLRHSVVAVAVLGAAAAAVMVAVPRTVIDVLFGHRYLPATNALRILAVSAAAIGVVTVCVYALLARRSVLCAASWPAIGVLAGVVAVVHHSPSSIAWVVLLVSAGLLVVTLAALVTGGIGRRSTRAGTRLDVGGSSGDRPGVSASLHTGLPPTAGTRTGTDA